MLSAAAFDPNITRTTVCAARSVNTIARCTDSGRPEAFGAVDVHRQRE